MTGIEGGLIFLYKSLLGIYIVVMMLRFILPMVGADYYNPITQFIVKLTNPVVKPFKSFLGSYQKMDLAVLVVIFILVMLKLGGFLWIFMGTTPNILGLLLWSFADILDYIVDIFFFSILIVVILSWVQPPGHNPGLEVLYRISEPVLSPVRRLIPPISGFDVSPIVVILILKFMDYSFVEPLAALGFKLTVQP